MKPLVVCIKVGKLYGPEYVNRLCSMVTRHLSIDHDFVCLTDDPRGLNCEWEEMNLPYKGWWTKLFLFKPKRSARRVIFLDLDTIIVKNCDFLLYYKGDFAILRDFYVAKGYGSAIMSISEGYGGHIWRHFIENHENLMRIHNGDQDVIRVCVPKADLWQDMYPDKIVSYKVHCFDGVPKEASIVCFHGEPKPHQLQHRWIEEHWR